MIRRWACVAAVIAITTGCAPQIDYPPPEQKKMPEGVDVSVPMIAMSDPLVRSSVVQDILVGEAGSIWFWTNQHPRLRLNLEQDAAGWEFAADFTVPDVVLKQTGPVTVKFVVNDTTLGSGRYSKDGAYSFHAPVKPELLKGREQVVFGLDVDPVYIAPGDGAKLGVLLQSIGFRKAALGK